MQATPDPKLKSMRIRSANPNMRLDQIQSSYGNPSFLTHQRSFSAKSRKIPTGKQGTQPLKQKVKGPSRADQLQQQNMLLKGTINKLVEQLAQQRGRTQTMRKKTQKYTKLLNAEFQNETYWSSPVLNTHMIAGIRTMYDQLKEKHQKLQKQYDTLSKKKNLTKDLQHITYIETLQVNHRQLLQRQNKAQQTTQLISGQSLQSLRGLLVELQQQRQTAMRRFAQVKSKYVVSNETLKDRNTKIQFLQKLIIEKDNCLHATIRSNKELTLQVNNLKIQVESLREQTNILQDNAYEAQTAYKQQLQSITKQNQQEINQIKNNYEQILSRLKNENEYQLSIANQLRTTNKSLSRQIHNFAINKQQNSQQHTQQNSQELMPVTTLTVNSAQSANQIKTGQSQGMRTQQRADNKHNQRAQKKRKVQQSEVQDIGQLLKLQLIARGIALKDILLHFDGDSSDQWQKQYITMQETCRLLTADPFNLPSQHSQIVARYLIEDVASEFVWVDLSNENTRTILKSEIRALLGNYRCLGDYQQQLAKVQRLYGLRLHSTLKQMSNDGTIRKSKFLQLLRSLNVECSSECQELMLAKMSEGAQSLNSLLFNKLFQENTQI